VHDSSDAGARADLSMPIFPKSNTPTGRAAMPSRR
jgi:hypothetical protein